MTQMTPEQEAFINEVGSTNTSIRLDAVAGSGKTTTLLAASRVLPRNLAVLALAFNKSTADELAKKFPANVECKTLNSYGNGVWYRQQGRVRLESKKMGIITSDWCSKNLSKDEAGDLWSVIRDTATTAKSSGYVPPMWEGRTAYPAQTLTVEVIEKILAEQDLSSIKAEFIFTAVNDIMLTSIAKAHGDMIDFDDQIYMTTYFADQSSYKVPDVILVDEAQDLSLMQHDLIERIGQGCRVIVAGDPNQAIYGWRGASTNSLDLLEDRFTLKRMPLTVSFRCPQAIVEQAQAIVPHIKAFKDGGTVDKSYIGEDAVQWYADDIPAGSAVLCRNNAPLVKLAFALIRCAKPCYLTGSEISAQLKKVAKGLPQSTSIRHELQLWYEKERDNLQAKGLDYLLDRHEDRYEVLLSILEGSGAKTPSELANAVEALFMRKPSPDAIELSTIHKAKGKEWSQVFFLNSYLIPGRWIVEMAEMEVPNAEALLQQEYNLMYVAITRSLNQLTYINVDKKSPVKTRSK